MQMYALSPKHRNFANIDGRTENGRPIKGSNEFRLTGNYYGKIFSVLSSSNRFKKLSELEARNSEKVKLVRRVVDK
jgi:hypothetical protein